MATISLKLELYSGKSIIINNIEEYASGYKYLYIRHVDGSVVAYSRKSIKDVTRVLSNGRVDTVLLKKPK